MTSLWRLDLYNSHSDCQHLQQRMQGKADKHVCVRVSVCKHSATLIVLTTCRLLLKRDNIFKYLFSDPVCGSNFCITVYTAVLRTVVGAGRMALRMVMFVD